MRRVVAVVAVLVTILAYGVLDVLDIAPGVLTRDTSDPYAGASDPAATPGATTAATPSPGVATTVPVPVTDPTVVPLLVAGPSAPPPSSAGVNDAVGRLLTDPRLGPSVGVTIRDGVTGERLLDKAAGTPREPASVAKLLTAAAVTDQLGDSARFSTRAVVRGTDIYLVAGGDMLLARGRGSATKVAGQAGLADLAETAAAALAAAGTDVSAGGGLRLLLDDTHAPGPRLAPGWAAVDVAYGLTGPVAMLGLADERPLPGDPAPTDPAMSAAKAFASALHSAGVTVSAPTRAKAPLGATDLGAVESARVADQLGLALDESDNSLTESLARSAAVDAKVGTAFATVGAWVVRSVKAMGVDTSGVTLLDASGLTRGSRVSARVLGDVLVGTSIGAEPQLQPVVAGLPVAGLTGTLEDRFLTAPARVGAGLVRAKTGTLTGISSLAGTLVDRDGRLVVFAIMADQVPASTGTPGARAALDAVTARLTVCGCR